MASRGPHGAPIARKEGTGLVGLILTARRDDPCAPCGTRLRWQRPAAGAWPSASGPEAAQKAPAGQYRPLTDELTAKLPRAASFFVASLWRPGRPLRRRTGGSEWRCIFVVQRCDT